MSLLARITLVSTLAATVGVAAPVATAATPACGSTLTTDTTLTADVTCPTGDGFTLADGVTLDLGGHVLRGSATGVGVRPADTGESSIVDGTLRGWRSAVSDSSAGASLTIDRVHVVGGSVAVSSALTVRRSRFDGASVLTVLSGLHNAIEDSVFVDTSLVDDDSTWAVSRSTFVRSSLAVSDGSVSLDHSSMTGRHRSGTGLSVFFGGLTVTRSSLSGFATGISADMSTVTIRSSVVRRNGTGISTAPNFLAGSTSIERSVFAANGTAMDLGDAAVVRDNLLKRNGAGIVAGPGEQSIENLPRLIEHNVVAFTKGTGILATESNVVVKRNLVFGGRGQAIVATGATDGGGNRAFLNRGRPQCAGVVCSPR